MVHVTRYDFASLFRKARAPLGTREEPRLVLHASLTNVYWIIIFGAVNALVALPAGLLHSWRPGEGEGVAVFGAIAGTIGVLAIAYFQRKARWLVAEPSGLSVTERTTIRKYSWREVREIMDLGYLGGAPAAKRYHIEFADGAYFSFLGDPDAMARLEELRPRWREEESPNSRGPNE
jgi:hypothetical protein